MDMLLIIDKKTQLSVNFRSEHALSAPMRNKQVLLGFNRDPQKVQQYTCSSNENKMEDAPGGLARVMGLMAMPLTR